MTTLALKTYSTAQLLDLWELTTSNPNEYIPVVRGWLMDELESRHPEAVKVCDDYIEAGCANNVPNWQ